MRTQTITFGWRDYSEKYQIKCDVCGKTMVRTVSSGCNDLADKEYRAELVRKLRDEAKRLETAEKGTCAACLKAKIAAVSSKTQKIPQHLCDDVNGLYNAYRSALADLAKPFLGKVVRYEGSEWVLESIDHWNDLTCYLRRINKTRPWQTTDVQDHCQPSELDVTEEVFANREKAVEAA